MASERNIKTIDKILDAYFSGTLPTDVELNIISWIMYGGHQSEKDARLKKIWEEIVRYESRPTNERKVLESLAVLKKRLGMPPVEMQPVVVSHRLSIRRVFLRVAAVVVPLLILGGVLFYTGRGRVDETVANVVVVSEDGVTEVALPDGSRVWLKQGAVLTYPEVFGDERALALEGEGYFKVHRDTAHPFVVNTEALAVRVLGTEFSVAAHKDNVETTVTLASGKVAVDVGGESHIMDRRAKLTYHKEEKSVLHEEIGSGESADWRGAAFEYADLNAIFDELAERYNIEIVRDRAAFAGEMVTLKLEGGETLETVLSRLGSITERFSYRMEENKVIIGIK